jgi:hypothetical protein
MSDRGSYRELVTRTASEVYQVPPRHAESHRQPLQNEQAHRKFTRAPRRVLLSRAALIALLAVLGEIAALGLSSVLNLGVTATGFAIAGVVLSAMWPLTRRAQ